MKNLVPVFAIVLVAISFVACGKKKDDKKSCEGYPAGYVQVTDPRMLQVLNGSGNYGGNNGGYYGGNNNVLCIDQYRYQQIRQQVYGSGSGNGNVNCQMYPTAPECQGGGVGGGGGNGSGGGGYHTDPYCDYYPYDPYCWNGGW